MIAEVHAELGPIAVLVNNAARVLREPLESTTLEQWRAVYAVNVEAVLAVSQLALADLEPTAVA